MSAGFWQSRGLLVSKWLPKSTCKCKFTCGKWNERTNFSKVQLFLYFWWIKWTIHGKLFVLFMDVLTKKWNITQPNTFLKSWTSSSSSPLFLSSLQINTGSCGFLLGVWLLLRCAMAAPGCESAWRSTQLPSRRAFLLAAQAQGGFAFHLAVTFMALCSFTSHAFSSFFPHLFLTSYPLKSPRTLQAVLCNLLAGVVKQCRNDQH